MKRGLFIVVTLVVLTGLSALAMYSRRGGSVPSVQTEAVSRGSVVSVVSATGTLEAVETVQVGTQVSGTVQTLNADFNSIVRKGQVLARLDPSVILADIERNRANVAGAEADVEGIRVTLADAETKLKRAQELFDRQLIAATELDAARIARRTNDAQLKAALAQVTQARATLAQSEVNLQKTVIASPINGIVISRAVDVGQTVAASLQAPTLFTIAADLAHMQLKASIDESDLGSIKEGQHVTFRVDAYPTDVFNGVVKQVRLNPVIESNVVTYAAMIAAENPQLKLKPGMTAALTVETARRDDVLRVPSAALRFKPSAAVLAALSQPEEAATRQKAGRPVGTSGDTKGPKPATSGSASGTVWTFDGESLAPGLVTVGASDATFTEIVDGPLKEGDRVVTQAMLPPASGAATRPSTSTSNPLMGQMPRRF
jgi:HlyD family secretion protein